MSMLARDGDDREGEALTIGQYIRRQGRLTESLCKQGWGVPPVFQPAGAGPTSVGLCEAFLAAVLGEYIRRQETRCAGWESALPMFWPQALSSQFIGC